MQYQYILIEIQGYGRAYQKVLDGIVIAYLDINGQYLYEAIPIGLSSDVVDPIPPQEVWMV